MHCHATGDIRRRLAACFFAVSAFVLLIVSTASADTLRGRVIDPDGRTVPGAQILLLRGQTIIATGTATDDGRYGPIAAPPGRYDIVVVAPGLGLPPTTVTIAAGMPVTQDLRLEVRARQESIVVSAAQTDTAASRSASSTSVIRRVDLERMQVSGLTEALRLVPGFNTAPSGTIGSQTSMFPRGGESDYTLVLVDGVPQNAFGGAFDAAHLATVNAERIEVVRGPQSALYGSGAIGGIVHVVSANGGRPNATATFEGGAYGRRASTAAGSASHGAWSFGGGFDWLESAGDTRTFNSIGGPVSNDDYVRVSGAGSLAWSDSPSRRVRLDVRGGRNERGFPGPYGSDPDGRYGGLDTVSRGTNHHTSVGLTAAIRSNQTIDHRMQMTWSRTAGEFVSPFGTSDDESGRFTGRYQMDSYLGETGVSAGMEVLRERAENTFITDTSFSPIPVRRSNVGLFFEARPQLTERVFATVGLRAERIDRTRLDGDGSRPAFDSSVVWSANPKVAVTWLLRDAAGTSPAIGDTRIRTSAGTGIKAPTAFDIAFTDNPDLRPERSRSIDVGIEQQAWRSRLAVDATWFHNTYDDLIVAVTQPLASASRYRTDNIANARASGLEFGAAIRWAAALSTRLSWTRLSTEVLGVDSLPAAGFGFYDAGDELIRRPGNVTSIETSWTTSRATVFVQVHHRGAMMDLEPNWASTVYTNPGRVQTTMGASMRVAPGLDVYGRLTNAFNRRYEDVLGFPAAGRAATIGLRVAAGR